MDLTDSNSGSVHKSEKIPSIQEACSRTRKLISSLLSCQINFFPVCEMQSSQQPIKL
jgi:hypothetical protein